MTGLRDRSNIINAIDICEDFDIASNVGDVDTQIRENSSRYRVIEGDCCRIRGDRRHIDRKDAATVPRIGHCRDTRIIRALVDIIESDRYISSAPGRSGAGGITTGRGGNAGGRGGGINKETELLFKHDPFAIVHLQM